MVRKFAFHMILAGHRFSKAGQVSITFLHGKCAWYLLTLKNVLNVLLVWFGFCHFCFSQKYAALIFWKITSALFSVVFHFCVWSNAGEDHLLETCDVCVHCWVSILYAVKSEAFYFDQGLFLLLREERIAAVRDLFNS